MNFYRELPENYIVDKTVDMKENKAFAVGFNVIALFMAIGIGLLTYFIRFGFSNHISIDIEALGKISIALFVSAVLMIAYMVLHELVHGVAYKLLTKEKLTFGITLSCAFCGVPNIYTTKKTSLIALLAPFTVFTIIAIPLIAFLSYLWSVITIIIFASHIGGCIGDLYCTFVLLFKYKGKKVLINDTGPKQTFYVPRVER